MAGYDSRPWLSSYADGVPSDYDFPAVPLTRLLDDAVESFPDRTAVAFLGTTFTYAELQELVDRFGHALQALGVGLGDRVATALANGPQTVIVTLACARIGAVVVHCNPLYTTSEMRHQLADSGAKVIVCLDKAYAPVREARKDTALEHVLVTSVIDYLPKAKQLLLKLPIGPIKHKRAEISAVIPAGDDVKRFVDVLAASKARAPQAEFDPTEHLAALQYTGGTTGTSKGAMLTHANLVANAYQARLWIPDVKAGSEVSLAVIPMFHAYGLTACLNLSLVLAATLVMLPKFDIKQTFAEIDKWRPTIFMGVPPMYKALAEHPEVGKHDLRSINFCISGAMKLPYEVEQSFERLTGGRLVEGFGLSECSPVTHVNPVDGRSKLGTIGMPLPGTHARICDPDEPMRQLPQGEAGELQIQGPQVMKGYWGRPAEERAQSFTEDGYLRTGDIAIMDDDGYFSIVDRIKELVISGGFNVYPTQVEEVLRSHDAVSDAAVVGVPDEKFGEVVKAFVIVRDGASVTADELKAHCAEQLAKYKVPRLIEFRDELPRSIIGKVLRRVLVEEEAGRMASATDNH